jgi:class 3 adenylate cyclase
MRHSTGIATGMAFCGIVGSATRREYTMIGDVVNLSARLMQAAKGGILCGPVTHDASRADVRYQPFGSIHVKGKTDEIRVYSPVEAPGTGRTAPPLR